MRFDPNAVCELLWCSTNLTAVTSLTSVKLPDGSRLDVGDYEYLLVTVLNMGGTGGATITPRVSLTQTGAEFNLDGSNGAPDFRLSFANAAETGAKSIVIPVAELGRFRFFNIVHTAGVPGAGTFRAGVTIHGFGLRTTSLARAIPSRKVPVNLA
jgi:hypothetical protein